MGSGRGGGVSVGGVEGGVVEWRCGGRRGGGRMGGWWEDGWVEGVEGGWVGGEVYLGNKNVPHTTNLDTEEFNSS